MSEGRTFRYTNGEIDILWRPNLCWHTGVCVKMLPNVYFPKESPWCKPMNATTEQLKAQIEKCPSGALSYVVRE